MDDFASKLTHSRAHHPAAAAASGFASQKVCTIHRDGVAVDMVSPVEGTVSDINQAVEKDPKLALRDPFGEGWLVTVNAPTPRQLQEPARRPARPLVDGRVGQPLQRPVPMQMPSPERSRKTAEKRSTT